MKKFATAVVTFGAIMVVLSLLSGAGALWYWAIQDMSEHVAAAWFATVIIGTLIGSGVIVAGVDLDD